MNTQRYLDDLIERAIAEDIGNGDHSSNSCIPPNARGKMQLIIKERGILAGVEVARQVFTKIDPDLSFEALLKDSATVEEGDVAFFVSGSEISLLQGERLALNFMQRMSGIATKTHELVELIDGTNAKVLDTRKTTPSMRLLEKMAVKMGGGFNHRMGLYDMIMLKDNHIDFAGGVSNAIENALGYLEKNNLNIPIEVETRNFGELEAVLKVGKIQRVMFDNYSVDNTYKAVKMVDGQMETESSGGITAKNIRDYAATGVDFISVGALTHSVKSLDMSLKAI